MIGHQLLRPVFGYLEINHPAKKVFDWYIPFTITAVLVGVIATLRPAVNIWGDDGFVAGLQGLLQGLPGFYIAALAVVATFGKQTSLDSIIPAPTPTIDTWYGGGKILIELSRRRFLSLLFSYLTTISILLVIAAAFFRAASVPVKAAVSPSVGQVLFFVTTGIYLFAFVQMIVVTFWGLYYLSDRIYQPDARPLGESKQHEAEPHEADEGAS